MEGKRIRWTALLLSAAIFAATGSTACKPVEEEPKILDPAVPLEITGGKITGSSIEESNVAVYKGIPYAAPPVGDLRWKAPQPVVPWEDVKICTEFGANPMQAPATAGEPYTEEFIIDTDLGYSEDCLTLNIWTNTDLSNSKKPVVVYLYGGAFVAGGSSCEIYDGQYLASQDVIFISLNYRVGIFGFLAHPDLSAESEEKTSGNYGLMDIIKALEWVKENISAFGGDPDNVTLMGQSAGSGMAQFVMFSPKAKGLVRNVMAMSLSIGEAELGSLSAAEASGKGIFGEASLQEMREMSSDDVQAKRFFGFPSIDGVYLTDSMTKSYRTGNANPVNLISGSVIGDMGFLFARFPSTPIKDKEAFENAAKVAFGELSDECLLAYTVTDDNVEEQVKAMALDGMMSFHFYMSRIRESDPNQKTFVYLFDHAIPGKTDNGAFHSGDIPYWLNYLTENRNEYWTQADRDMADTMSQYLINFAKTGQPGSVSDTEWESCSEKLTYQYFDNNAQQKGFEGAKADFWQAYLDSLYEKYKGE